MEALKQACEQEEQLLIPREQASAEVTSILAAHCFFEIVSSVKQEEEAILYFCKFSTPQSLPSLQKSCESGKDVILLLGNLIDPQDADKCLTTFNYAIAKQTKAVMPSDSSLISYYTKIFDEQLEIELEPEYINKSNKKTRSILSNYTVKYKTFTLGAKKNIIETLLKPAGWSGLVNEQKLAIETEIDISGESNSILMQVSAFRVGTVKSGFCDHTNEDLFGFYPDSVRLSIEPKCIQSVPVLVVQDEKLAEVSYNITKERTREVKMQGSVDVGINLGILNLTPKFGAEVTTREPETVAAASMTPVYEGSDNQIFEWKMKTWENGQPYNWEKPHAGMRGLHGWRRLPYPGTGPIITGIDRVRWKVPEESMISNLSFELTVEAMMVLLEKKAVWNLCGFGGLVPKSTRAKVTHKAVIQLKPL